MKPESRSRKPFPSAFPSLSPRQETIISPDARQWEVWGYASPVFCAISAGSTTLCNEGAFGSFTVSITYMRLDLKIYQISWMIKKGEGDYNVIAVSNLLYRK